MKKKWNIRILSAVLALILLMSDFPVITRANDGFFIACDGRAVSGVSFYEHEKLAVTAQNLPEGTYQWQIRVPGTELWVNIHGQTAQTLNLSYALLGSLLDGGSAYVRCAAVSGGEEVAHTAALRATVEKEPEETAAPVVIPEPTAGTSTEKPAESTKQPTVTAPAPAESVPASTEPAAAPTESVVAPTEAIAAPTEPVAAPTEAVIAPTEAVSAPTEAAASAEATENNTEESAEAPAETVAVQTMVKSVSRQAMASTATEETTPPTEANSTPAAEPAEEDTPVDEGTDETTTPSEADSTTGENIAADEGAGETTAPTEADTVIDSDAEIVSVTVQYIYVKNNSMAVDPYVANIKRGTDLNVTVSCKVFPGFQARLAENYEGVALNNNEVTLDLTNVTTDLVFEVHYVEVEVPYQARYFMQNIYNDLYTEKTDVLSEEDKQKLKGYAGSQPDEKLIYPDIAGFSALFHQPDTIAADGSTVFEVYYDRNYYLMNFDLNGGYGTAPVYARYGTSFTVPNPTRHGYVFQEWELISVGGAEPTDDQKARAFPTSIPAENRTYRAVWTTQPTTYTVAYWLLSENGTGKTYIGSSANSAISGAVVSGSDNLGSAAICGYENHTHSDDCMSCGHMHTISCVGNQTVNSPSSADLQAFAALGDGEPENGYVYTIEVAGKSGVWYKLRFNNTWYNADSSMVSGSALKEASLVPSGWSDEYTAKKYYAALSCGHAHSASCTLICDADLHTHTDDCYASARNLEFVRADTNVTVEGDGSAVVNVYYQYKEYTLKFYYAATTGGTDSDGDGINDEGFATIKIVGGSTYYFGRSWGTDTSDDETQLNRMYSQSTQWGSISALPSLTADGAKRGYTKGALTNDDGVTFHYISFKARYGDDISDMWPCGVFESATRTDKNSTNGWSGTAAFVSAWNGEHHVAYSRNANETIKGVYEKLDDQLLFHSDYTDETEVSYLCFWENGANISWSIPELYRYNIYLEVLPKQDLTGETVVVKDEGTDAEKKYYLFSTYDTCDDSTVGQQTQPALQGYTPKLYGTTFESVTLTEGTDYDGSMYKEGYAVNFYYTRSSHTLFFWNHDGYLTDGRGVPLTYGTPLQIYGTTVNAEYMQPYYPETLEPDSYEFKGWYTSADCLDGTEMDWSGTMPDSDLKVYAKWAPKTYNTYFYMDYDHYLDRKNADGTLDMTKVYQTATGTPHGERMDTTELILIPSHENSGYKFVGWFYINGDGEKEAFNPSEMAVRQELHLYAEWSTTVVKQYTVSYALGEWDETTKTVIPMTGDAYRELASDLDGYAFEATTRTFTAKSRDQLDQLTTEEKNQLWLPHTNSHSILMKGDNDQNVFTFYYITQLTAPYTVRYLDAATGDALHAAVTYDKNTDAVVTEQFVYIPGYIPDTFYKRLVLSANSEENVITFYYTKDKDAVTDDDGSVTEDKNALYQVSYFIQTLDGMGFEEYTSNSYVGQIGATVTETPISIPGFTFAERVPIGDTEYVSITEGIVGSGKDENSEALELKLYYTRNQYSYTVEYLDNDTRQAVRDPKTTAEDYYLDKVVEETAPAVPGYDLYGNATQTLKISSTEALNKITFLYTKKQVTVNYKAVCKNSAGAEFGVLTNSQDTKTINGSQAIPKSGFRFVGWYSDAECENQLQTAAFYKPDVSTAGGVYDYTYYALFEPILLIISQKNVAPGDSAIYEIVDSAGNVVTTVILTGESSVTIEQIPAGTYTVREVGANWTWTYQDTTAQTVDVDTAETKEVTFEYTAADVDWLHGENHN